MKKALTCILAAILLASASGCSLFTGRIVGKLTEPDDYYDNYDDYDDRYDDDDYDDDYDDRYDDDDYDDRYDDDRGDRDDKSPDGYTGGGIGSWRKEQQQQSAGSNEDANESSEEQIPAAAQPTDAQMLAMFRTHIEMYNKVLDESFGVETSEVGYIRAYNKDQLEEMIADDYNIPLGFENVARLVTYRDLENLPDDLAIEPGYVNFFPVSNYSNLAQIRVEFERYMDPSLFTERMNINFYEHDGTLYLIRGARGYGGTVVAHDSSEITKNADGTYTVKSKVIEFDDFYGTYFVMTFAQIGGTWKIINVD